ncbi:disease resistance protein RGA2-like [Papaver somniferum]|uniref:disease resistance protein RGA2-like n=1 Tax=Papaver somniferum TaxID=3469 RepID=UPI000E6F8E29|nr:disease resistance protein RGA2-like [Papaver somniferum]
MAFEGILQGALERLGTTACNEISLAWGVEDELRRLKQRLEVIAAVTSDAERKQVNDAAVSLWLKRLKEVSYDADDVLDEICYEAMRRSNKNSKVKVFFSSSNQVAFRLKMSRRIKGINTQLNQIADDMERFHFQTNSSTSSGGYQQNRLTTSLFGDVSKFVGRKVDRSNIVRMLTTMSISSSVSSPSSSSVNSDQHEKVSVISIVGMGGLGKTSLAQSIYSDKSVEKYFEKKMWVCISDDFDVLKILKNIMESATFSKCQEFSNPQVLVKNVREILQGRKYLLVLDDLWNEDPMEWNKLKSVLDFGAVGSKILITTRSQIVASVVQGLIPPYNLNVLSEAECWSIIKNKAFAPGGASETANMKIIGEQIAKRCGGLPLAASFFGSLMFLQSDERHWLSFRDNKSLETPENHNGGIIPILKLSYDTLPSHLKQCFSYCCLFPKDWRYNRETMIRLWMAEGFIHPSHGGNRNSLEDIGNDYFLSLLSSSFFQDVETDDHFGDIETFKMHDLVHDLALSVIDSHEVAYLNTSAMENDVSRIRRLRLMLEGTSQKKVDVLKHATKLRTIFFQKEDYASPFDTILEIPSPLRNIRVIHRLFGPSGRVKTTSSSFNFKHMRYLDLSYSNLKTLNLNQLYNLQTLNLHVSHNFQKIVKGIGSLINLRHLDLTHSDAKFLPNSITRLTNLHTLAIRSCRLCVLPSSIGNLQNLSSLDISFTKISVLPDSFSLLQKLRNFSFKYCSQLDALPRNFGDLTQLRSLDLTGTGITELPESLTSNLCKLEIVKFRCDSKFPIDINNWVELRRLTLEYEGMMIENVRIPRGIENLTRLEELVPYIVRKEDDTCSHNSSSGSMQELADLNSLRRLSIVSLENARGGKIESERAKLKDKLNIQYLSLQWRSKKEEEEEEVSENNSIMVLEGLQPHPNLERLSIEGFPGLKIPKWIGSSSCHPNLVKLRFSDCKSCEKLVGLGQLPCLQNLRIEGMNSVKYIGNEFYYQQQEEEDEEESKGCAIAATPTSRRTSFPSLTKLGIVKLENLEEWLAPPPPHNSFPCLKRVYIFECGNLACIPDLLCSVLIRGCKKLE